MGTWPLAWQDTGVQQPDEPEWRRGVDLSGVEVGLAYLAELLDAVHVAGGSMLIRVDGERTGANPSRFTVAITSSPPDRQSRRYDDSDLARAVARAVADFDSMVAVADR